MFQMVMQAKLERRRRRHSEDADKPDGQGVTGPGAGHPQNIPPPSEPVLSADAKSSVPKPSTNGPALTPVTSHADGTVYRPNPNDAGAANGHQDARVNAAGAAEEVRSNQTMQKG